MTHTIECIKIFICAVCGLSEKILEQKFRIEKSQFFTPNSWINLTNIDRLMVNCENFNKITYHFDEFFGFFPS